MQHAMLLKYVAACKCRCTVVVVDHVSKLNCLAAAAAHSMIIESPEQKALCRMQSTDGSHQHVLENKCITIMVLLTLMVTLLLHQG